MLGRTYPQRRTRRAALHGALMVSDLLAMSGATLIAGLVDLGLASGAPSGTGIPILGASVVMCAVWFAVLRYGRLYDLDHVFVGSGEFSRVLRALSIGTAFFILAEYATQLPFPSRTWTFAAWAFSSVLVVGGRAIVRVAVSSAHRHGRLLRPTLIAGCNAEACDIVRVLRKDPSSGLVPVGCISSASVGRRECDPDIGGSVPHMGSEPDIGRVLDEHFVDTVIIASTAFDHNVVARIINDLRGRDVDIRLSSGLFDVTTSRVLVREVSGVPLIALKSVGFAPWQRWVKRAFDVTFGVVVTLVGLPVWLLLALAIKIDSRGPVLYRQERVGRDGKPFGMLKFRSMQLGAHERLDELLPHNEATGPLFKMKDDPRVTRVGRFLRKYSLDEFPQILNVLRGEMSLVGPRPSLPQEMATYTEYERRRLEVLPGMTGLWQVSGRSKLTFEEMVRLDLFYIENWTVSFDLGLLMRTIPAVLFSHGAY